jgi:hypothetical protein
MSKIVVELDEEGRVTFIGGISKAGDFKKQKNGVR